MKKAPVIHPFLFAIYPVLFLFAHNLGQVAFHQIALPLATTLGFATLLMLFSQLILRDYKKAGIAVSVFLVLFFSYGYAYDATAYWQICGVMFTRHRYLLPFWAALIASSIYPIIKARKNLDAATKILNVIASFLVAISLVNILIYELKISFDRHTAKRIKANLAMSEASSKEASFRPDIYYIVLDQYARADVLKEMYNFDNSEFLDYLSRKGFYIASKSTSNYSTTAHSLPSLLNMMYINDIVSNKAGRISQNWRAMYKLIQDYKVQSFLKSKGYKYVHVGTLWEPTTTNKNADMNINLYFIPEFSLMVYNTTIMFPIFIKLGIYNPDKEQWLRIQYEFDELAKIPDIKEPTFVFAHMFIPHGPCVFDKDGNFLTEDERGKMTREENYIGELIYLNKKVMPLIDKILSASEIPPIIVIQSDEGPYPPRYHVERYKFEWKDATEAELRQKIGILSAYYLPNVDKNVLYPTMTPVNTFRLIFNQYFHTDFPLLPDRNYVYKNESYIYTFIDVTDKINHK
jgi:uncharacterized membrane protein